jgi:uncharacterized protein YjbI with pentapeptide repeats
MGRARRRSTIANKGGPLSGETEDQQSPPTAQAFVAKANDLESLRDAVADAAGVAGGLWVSYLFLFFYLFIAVAAVTHRDLFLENPIKLPFLDVELPLLGFFVLGPLLFLVLHTYVLLHFVMFADKVGVFRTALQAQISDDNVRAGLRRQLPSNIFVGFLAGPHEIRTGVMGLMLRLIAVISLVLFPLALLVFFQLQFLPYHHGAITWWHRLSVLVDLVLLWMLWPSIATGRATLLTRHDFRRGKIVALMLASLIPVLLVFSIATFPGEWLDTHLPSVRLVPTTWELPTTQTAETSPSDVEVRQPTTIKNIIRQLKETIENKIGLASSFVKALEWTSFHDLLVAGDIDLVTRKPTSLWSNRLVLPGIDVIDRDKFDTEEKIAAMRESVSLRGRRLEGAVLIDSDLRKADFTAAQLQGAHLQRADLRGAQFNCAGKLSEEGGLVTKTDCARLDDAELDGANLQGASLKQATLADAVLIDADFRNTTLTSANLEGALLNDANLQRVSLEKANLKNVQGERTQLQGATLDYADLSGANLSGVELQGASFSGATLIGASLGGKLTGAVFVLAELDGAELSGNLQGSAFSNVTLQAADLSEADLRGSYFEDSSLQGAKLDRANFDTALLKHTWVWRADPRSANMVGAMVVEPMTDYADLGFSLSWLKSEIEARIPAYRRDEVLKRITAVDPKMPMTGEADMANAWSDLAKVAPSISAYNRSLVHVLRDVGCAPEGAPFVIHEFIPQLLSGLRPELAQLAIAFSDETNCPGAQGLSEEDKTQLRVIADRSSQTPEIPPASTDATPATSRQ